MPSACRAERGVTLVDTIVGTALMLLVFVGIAAAFQLSLDVVTNNRIRAGAIALLNERMEYLRSLSYTQIGVEGGIPSGNVPQIETVSWNGVDYTRRTSVLYADDPEDGESEDDENGIIADYKVIRVEVSWDSRQGERSVSLVGRVSPPGVETGVPGGVLTIYVVNESAVPLPDAQVDIINNDVSPAIDVRTFTNTGGVVSFIGAPAGSNYQVTVSRPGYSTAQTYAPSAGNPNPDPRHLTVAESETTTATFVIDVTATKIVETREITHMEWTDAFNDASLVSATSSTEVAAGAVSLEGGAPYPSFGTVRSVSIAPSPLAGWSAFSWEETTPAGTSITYRVYDASNTLIPDAILPNNSTGFTTSPVSLLSISPSTYPMLRIGATLATSDSDETPVLGSWSISYEHGPEPLPEASFSMQGFKTIGNNPTVYKYDEEHTTDSSGSFTLADVEADTYRVSVATTTGYTVYESCDTQPEILTPNDFQTTLLSLIAYDPETLLVDVRAEGSTTLLSDASVRLYAGGFDETRRTSSCGQAFFGGLAEGSYTIEVSHTGYQTDSSIVDVADVTRASVVLDPL